MRPALALPRPPDNASISSHQAQRIQRLAHVAVKAGKHGLFAIFFAHVGGQGDRRDSRLAHRRAVAHRVNQVVAVASGHGDVADQGVEFLLPQQLFGGIGRTGAGHLGTGVAQEVFGGIARIVVVVHQQQVDAAQAPGHRQRQGPTLPLAGSCTRGALTPC